MLDGSWFFECECGSSEHTMRFVIDKQDNLIYCDFYLKQFEPWYKRIYIALKYILKMRPHNSHFSSWILKKDDVEKLSKMCDLITKKGESCHTSSKH